MDDLTNLFSAPTRREVLRWGAACGAAGALCQLHLKRALAQQDTAGTGGGSGSDFGTADVYGGEDDSSDLTF